jgi:transcription termination/antitermination protein NusG
LVPDIEIEAIQRALNAALPLMAYPYLREGQRVRLTRGPLSGIEGILVQSKPKKGLLILSIDLLQRSVAVEVNCSVVTAA